MPRPEEKFLQQASKGHAYWRMQRMVALVVLGLFIVASLVQLWRAFGAVEARMEDLLIVVALLAAACAAAMWHVHAEIMQGAAVFLENQARAQAKDETASA